MDRASPELLFEEDDETTESDIEKNPAAYIRNLERRVTMKSRDIIRGCVVQLSETEVDRRYASMQRIFKESGSPTSPRTLPGDLSLPDESTMLVIEAAEDRQCFVPGKLAPINYLFDGYKDMFGRRHINFTNRQFSCRRLGINEPVVAIASIPAIPDNGVYRGLLRTYNGYSELELPVKIVEMEGGQLDLVAAFSRVLSNMVDPPTSAPVPIPTTPGRSPRNKTFGGIIQSIGNKVLPDGKQQQSIYREWHHVNGASFQMELLAQEIKLSLAKEISVGLVLVHPNQLEEEAVHNTKTEDMRLFFKMMRIRKIRPNKTKRCPYLGGVSPTDDVALGYTEWHGFQFIFHLASEFNDTMIRQHIGNDKVMVYFLSDWSDRFKFAPRFRSKMNSVGITVRQTYISADGTPTYRINCFHRMGLENVGPDFTNESHLIDEGVRDNFMIKLINSHVACYKLLYGDRIQKTWDTDLEKLVNKYVPSDALLKRRK